VLSDAIGRRAVRILEHPRLAIILSVLGVAATLPALRAGLLNDDLHHWAVLAGPSQIGDELSSLGISGEQSGRLSTAISEQFAPTDPKWNFTALKNYGALPWWTYDGLWVRFWRPLSSLTHWIDYRLFGTCPAAMHAHNLVWLGAVLFLVTVLYRRLMAPGWMAGLAALMYMIDDFSYFPAMWIANRNIFLSLFFGVLCLLWHHRWRESRSPAAGVGSVAFLIGSLLSAEAGVATCAYLFAYAAALDKGGWVRRGLSLAPAAAATAAWRMVYNALGHGAGGGSFYLDPTREPLRYTWAVLVRGPILIMREWSGIAADIFSYLPTSATILFWPLVVVFVVVVWVVLLPLLRASRMARFWLIGMHLSILPVCATMPMNRNLLFVGIGACGLIALYVGGYVRAEQWVPKSRVRRWLAQGVCVMLVLGHLPFALAARIASPVTTSLIVGRVKETMEIDSPEGMDEQYLVVVNAPNPASFFYIPFLKAYEGQALPRGIRVLAPSFGTLDVIREDDRSLTVRSASGNLLSCRPDRMLDMDIAYLFEAVSEVRGADHGLRAGQKIDLPGMSVEVLEVDGNGMPVAALFRFAVSLDDPSLRWLHWSWKKDRYLPFKVPGVGERVSVRGPF